MSRLLRTLGAPFAGLAGCVDALRLREGVSRDFCAPHCRRGTTDRGEVHASAGRAGRAAHEQSGVSSKIKIYDRADEDSWELTGRRDDT